MQKRTITATLLAFFLTVGVTALWSAAGDEREGDTASNVVADAGAETGQAEVTKKKGNRFARFFKAPFKAVGKVFGAGGDDRKMARMTEKDMEKFESVGVVRVEERAEATRNITGSEGTARDSLDHGRALLEAGRLNEAIAELSRAASLDSRLSQAHSLLAVAYDRKGLHDRAKKSYERAIDLNESDAQAMNNLGYSLYLNGNYRAAVDRLKRAAKLAPSDTRILNNLALAQSRLGKYDDAYKNFARASGEFGGHTNVGALLERMGRDEDALKHYEAAHRLQPNSASVLRRLVDIYGRTGRAAQSETARQALAAEDARQSNLAVAGGR